MTKIAIIVGSKGRGSNMRAIIKACQAGELEAAVALVIGPSRDAPALQVAREMGMHAVVLDQFDAQLLGTLVEHKIDLICLAGYMRLIPEDVVETFHYRMLNIHPALLPKFGGKGMWGMKVHEAVIAAGELISGCTVHFVSDRYDEGATLLQKTCHVLPHDTPEMLAGRVLSLEHRCYIDAIKLWLERNPYTDR